MPPGSMCNELTWVMYNPHERIFAVIMSFLYYAPTFLSCTFHIHFMLGRAYIPHPALQDFVLQIITVDQPLPLLLNRIVTPYPPTPLQSIMFYGDDRISAKKETANSFELQPPIVVVGPQYSRVNLMVSGKLKAIRVDFKPGGLYRLLRIPMHALYDGGFDAREVIGNQANGLNERILHAPNMESAKNIVEQFLLEKRNNIIAALPFDEAMWRLMNGDEDITIEKTASWACLSLRQFERKCHERIGMSPKSFARIIRFSKAYRLREAYPNLTWTSIAYQTGYYDQMHMIRDFKQFAGVTPTLLERDLSLTPFRMQANLLK